MNHYSRLIFTLLVAALITGCASHATLRILSEPQGAYITDDSGRLLGTTPLEVSYPIDTNAGTCIETHRFSALWVSGVEAEIQPIVLCEAGYASTLINRGFSQPGLAEDRAFAVQLEMLELQRQQTFATQQAADASWAAAAAARDAADAMRRSTRSGYPQDQQRERNYRDNYRDNERGQERREDSYRVSESLGANRQDRSRNQVVQPVQQAAELLATEVPTEEAGLIVEQGALVPLDPTVVATASEPAVEFVAEPANETTAEFPAEPVVDTTAEAIAETTAETAPEPAVESAIEPAAAEAHQN